MKKITEITVLDQTPETSAKIAKTLLEDGAVKLRIPRLMDALKQTTNDLDPYLMGYPNCEGVFFGYKTKRFGGVFAKSEASQALATDQTLMDVMNEALGPFCDSFQINLTQAISILPGETEQLPHRDDEMFPIQHEGQNFMVNAIWAMTDFTYENGGTRIWVGSHRQDLTREPNQEDMSVAEMEAGEVLLYLGNVLHHGGANKTDKPRNGLVISYSLGWLRQSENQYLVYPPEIAKDFPKPLQDLVGYQAHRPNLGWVDGQDPSILLDSNERQKLHATRDLLPPELEQLVKEMAA